MDTTTAKRPGCGSEDVLPVLYGYPGLELVEESRAGRVKLGGCTVWPDLPEFHCDVCEHGWHVSEMESATLPSGSGYFKGSPSP